MKTLIMSILVVFISYTPVQAFDEWTIEDTFLQSTYTLFHVLDLGNTIDNVYHPESGRYELNPILGKYPNKESVYTYFVTTWIIHTAISYYLPKPYRTYWQMITIGMEANQVHHNLRVGVHFSF